MKIVCDYRENRVIALLNKAKASNNKYNDIECDSQNLTVGDFLIGNVIIERKTLNDLASSILDGRYKEQCHRLQQLQSEQNIKVIYFIEGNINLFIGHHNITKNTLISAIISIVYEHNFNMIMTNHMNETCDYLLKLCLKYYTKYDPSLNQKCNENATVNLDQISNNDSNASISLSDANSQSDSLANIENLVKQQRKKNDQITRENIHVIMLSNIPGISVNVSKQILDHFNGDIVGLFDAIRQDDKCLEGIYISDKNGKTRKLPRNIIQKITELMTSSPV